MDELAGARIVGVYTTQQARSLPDRTGFSLALEALNGALADAGMTLDEIDGFSSSVSGWPPDDGHWARQLRRQWKWSDAGVGPNAVVEAASLITSGYLNAAALVYASVRDTTGTTGGVAPWLQGVRSAEWTAWPGSIPNQPVQFGIVAQRYMHEVGEQARYAMADVAASTRNFGSINPDAVYSGRGPFTAEDVLDSRPIASPLTLLMCSAVTDGGCAVILSRRDRASEKRQAGRTRRLRSVADAHLDLLRAADARELLRARAALSRCRRPRGREDGRHRRRRVLRPLRQPRASAVRAVRLLRERRSSGPGQGWRDATWREVPNLYRRR